MSGVELTITVQDNNTVRAKRSEGGEVGDKMEFDKLCLATINIFEEWLNQSKISRRRELEVLGTHLYEGLFVGQVETFFEKALQEAKTAEQRLRVRLNFQQDAEELSRLPWEYLYYPDTDNRRGFFFSTHMDLVLSRYMPLETGSQNFPPVESKLHILLVISNPKDTSLGPVVAEPIIEAVQKLGERYPIAFDRLEKPTINTFSEKLRKALPHVVHFFGPGRYNKDEEKAEIALLDADGESMIWLDDKGFTDCFLSVHPIPRLVVLHLCESSTIDFTANFDRLAPELIRAGIQAVVAMKYPMVTMAATVFSRAFYNELAKGESVDTAVQKGRYYITTSVNKAYDSRVFGTPVLYMQSSEVIFLPLAEAAGKSIKVTRNTGSISSEMQPTQVDEPKGESTQTEPAVDRNPSANNVSMNAVPRDRGSEPSSSLTNVREGAVDTSHRVETIVEAAKKTIREATSLTVSQRVQWYQRLDAIRKKLVGKQPSVDDIINVLLGERVEPDDEFGTIIIQSMLDALEG